MKNNNWNNLCKREYTRIKRVFIIASEGTDTEPEYFTSLNSMSIDTTCHIVENLGNGSDPKKVLARMKKYLREQPLEADGQAWIVIDQDRWTPEQLDAVLNWTKEDERYHCALSIERFEHWLGLHVYKDKASQNKYRLVLIGKDKHIPQDFLTKARILCAIDRAKKIANTSRNVGNAYKLLEEFFKKT